MARTPEGKVKDACVKMLKARNAYYFFPATGGFGRSGVPDIVVCHGGRFIGIECKATPKNKPTALQYANLHSIMDANGKAVVIHNENLDLLTKILNEVETN